MRQLINTSLSADLVLTGLEKVFGSCLLSVL